MLFRSKWDSLVGRYSNGYLPATKWQHLLSVDWSQAEWGAGLSSHYLSGYTDQLPDANGNSIKVDAYSIWNGYVSYKPSKTSKLLFGVRNLFDTNPPFSNQNQNWQAGYNPVFSDPLGRTFYVKLKFAF